MVQKKYYFYYDFACKKVPLSLQYTKIVIYEPSAERRCSRMSAFFQSTSDERASAFN
jgi:hypothetical protein